MMLLSLLSGLRVIQVPVNYLPRVGTSSVTGDPLKAVALGLWMIKLVLEFRLRSWVPVRTTPVTQLRPTAATRNVWTMRDSEAIVQARAQHVNGEPVGLDGFAARPGSGAARPWRG